MRLQFSDLTLVLICLGLGPVYDVGPHLVLMDEKIWLVFGLFIRLNEIITVVHFEITKLK